MRSLRGWLKRILGLFRKRREESEFSAELESHLAMHVEDNLGRGMAPGEARRQAVLKLGGLEQTKESYRDRRGIPHLERFLEDLRYGVRILGKSPGFTLVAVLTLALGIGANTAIFSVVNGVLLRPLPYAEPDRLVSMTSYYPKGPFVVLRDASRTMEVAANTDATEFNLTGVNLPVRLTGSSVSANWFGVLRARTEMGRTFWPGEDRPGKNTVVILSHALWQRRFAGDPHVLGRSITLDGASHEIVGVMPPDFRFPSPKTELWVPLHLDPGAVGDYWGSSYMPLVARLRPDRTLAEAQAELAALRTQVLAAFPWRMPDNSWSNSTVLTMQEIMVGDVRARLVVLLAAVGLLLLIACANVANLLLARATSRQTEIAVRTALGATRGRLAQQLTTESLLLAVLGGGLGLVAAVYGLAALKAVLPADMPRLADVSVDGRVLGFTGVLAVLTGLIFGAMPAVGAARVDLVKSLGAGVARAGGGSHRLSRGLIVGEVAVAAVLVIGAGLLVKSLYNLSNTNPGFRPESIVTARVTPNESFCEAPGRCQTFYSDLLARIRTLPGVRDVAAVNGLPLTGAWEAIPADIEGHTYVPGQHVPMLMERVVTPDYFTVMGIALLGGRALTEADAAASAERVTLLSRSSAEHLWPGKNPIGMHVKARWMDQWWTVVGIVADVREESMTRNMADWIDGEMYVAYGPHAIRGRGAEGGPAEMTLVMRTSADQAQIGAELEGAVAELNGDAPVSQVDRLDRWVSEAVAGPRSTASLFALFAALALVLGAVGIYGVISYSVAQRTREIGIRVALGARRTEVMLLIVSQSIRLALAGVAIGLAGALFLTRLMAGLLYGVGAADPSIYAGVALLLLVVAFAAASMPARRAMRVDPMVALRHE